MNRITEVAERCMASIREMLKEDPCTPEARDEESRGPEGSDCSGAVEDSHHRHYRDRKCAAAGDDE